MFDLPLEFTCLTHRTIRDAMDVLHILIATMHILSICKRCKKLITNLIILWFKRLGGAELIYIIVNYCDEEKKKYLEMFETRIRIITKKRKDDYKMLHFIRYDRSV